jgi:parvulin-like peptidyl-prolyl isomerase
VSERRARALLALGAALGLAAAAVGLLRSGTGPSRLALGGDGVVASVNGEPVRLDAYRRAVAALASDRRNPLDAEDRRHVLDRMIDEELLVQRGLELGLARHDRRVRADLVQAVIASILADADERPPSDAEIAELYRESLDYFTRPGRLHVRQVLVRGEDEPAWERARRVTERLRLGEALDRVAGELGDAEIAPLPDDLLPAAKLRDYLGPSALRSALALEPGEVSDPVSAAGGLRVLLLVRREPAQAPPLADVEDEVRAEWRRRAGDRALQRYLDALRESGDVRIAEPLP